MLHVMLRWCCASWHFKIFRGLVESCFPPYRFSKIMTNTIGLRKHSAKNSHESKDAKITIGILPFHPRL